MELQAFLQRLRKVTRSSDGWSACCPAHDDKDPSLSVTEKNGKILVHCHASPPCTVEAICAAMDISKADLFTDKSEVVGPSLGAPVASYEYRDEWGNLLYRKNRYATPSGKTFRIQRHTESGWAWGIKDTRRVLYRLPELLEAIRLQQTVYVVDGEKDADALWDIGVPGTCDPMGAGKWRQEYGDTLAQAAKVVIVADREDGGLEQASTVAFSLGGRTEYEIVESAVGKDAYDHLKSGKTVGDLIPVGGLADLLTQVETWGRRFTSVGDHEACAYTLWTMHCWTIDAAYSTPYLHITSAEEESGKTRLMEVLEMLVPRPVLAADMSDATLYHIVDPVKKPEGWERPTLFLDEVDSIFSTSKKKDGSKDTFRSLLNAGYRRGLKVYRMGGQNNRDLEEFEVFSAKALAGLGDLPRTLASRCIRIEMKRRSASEPVEEFNRQDLEAEAAALREKLLTWRERALQTLPPLRPQRVHGLRDRTNEVWRPLLAIASLAGDVWEQRARDAAVELAKAAAEPSFGVLLLEDIRSIFIGQERGRILTSELLDWLYLVEESPWAEWWKDGKGGPRGVAKLLKPYGIKSMSIRTGMGRGQGYKREQFHDTWERLLAPFAAPPISPDIPDSMTSLQMEGNGRPEIFDTSELFPDNPEGGWE